MNILSAIITLILMGVFGFGWYFFLMLALNGFSERDVNGAIIFFIVWTIIFAILLSAGSFFLTRFLINKAFNVVLAVILSVVAAGAVGLATGFGGLIISTIIASEVRESYKKK